MNLGGTIKLKWTGWLAVLSCMFLIIFIHFSWKGEVPSNAASNSISMKALLLGAIQAAELGGHKVKEGASGELNIAIKGKTMEGVNDPVTDADYASHCVMYGSLLATFSSVHVKSEEHSKGDCPKASALSLKVPLVEEALSTVSDKHIAPDEVTIWIDPLDATKEYTDKLHQYVTTMVCVAVRGVPIMGVIHKPFSQITSWAWVGERTSSDLLRQEDTEESRTAPRIVVSISHSGDAEKLSKAVFGDKATVTPAAGAGYKVLEVAHDAADLYLHTTHIKKWDICAGNAIINALGGTMTSLNNLTFNYAYDSDELNKDGLLASIKNPYYYVNKISRHKS